MQTTDFWNCDDLAMGHDCPLIGSVLTQGQAFASDDNPRSSALADDEGAVDSVQGEAGAEGGVLHFGVRPSFAGGGLVLLGASNRGWKWPKV